METTYKHTIENMDGEELVITLNRLTVRHGLRLTGLNEAEATEAVMDMVAPGVLDIIAPLSLQSLVEVVMEKEKGFFAQMAEMRGLKAPKAKGRPKNKITKD